MPRYSQNFLTSPAAAEKISSACERLAGDVIIEIGPGKGFLTKRLVARGLKIIAVEIDPFMVETLRGHFGENLQIIQSDFLKLDITPIVAGKRAAFVGNLPYAAASAILRKILSCPEFYSAVLMFQKEVAEKMLAKTGDSDFGLLSLSVQAKSRAKLIARVGRGSFFPAPAVDSAVMEFEKLEKPFFQTTQEEEKFFIAAKAAFAHRRKTILNSMSQALGRGKTEISALLNSAGIAPTLRPQDVSLSQYLELGRKFS